MLKTCCCCCDVRTGTNIIGFVRLIYCLFGILAEQGWIGWIGDEYVTSPEEEKLMAAAEEAHGIGQLITVSLFVASVELPIAIMMATGVLTKSGKLLVPWMIREYVIAVLNCLIVWTAGQHAMKSGRADMAVQFLFGLLLFTVPRVYFVLVVLSHYINLIDEEKLRNSSIIESRESLLQDDKPRTD